VADTVEAMSHNRPYRPSLGIDKALGEVEAGKGSLYDERAVDACLKLFRHDSYEFPVV
jgi:HD-GYP domain-containing protein (c-di-GMP phosphodiesterase class II)